MPQTRCRILAEPMRGKIVPTGRLLAERQAYIEGVAEIKVEGAMRRAEFRLKMGFPGL